METAVRLIVLGDLHGCMDELSVLLGRLDPAPHDRVACVGDFLTKGPRTLECLDLWRVRGWDAVLGNNDREVLRVVRGEPGDHKPSVEDEARRIAERAELVEYLESLPLLLDYPGLDSAVVHGGVVPGSSFTKGIDATELLTLRDVVKVDSVWRAARSSDPPEARRFWADVWTGDRFVVYGHTPRREAARHGRALGIDTGCVYGWSLTAAVRSEEGVWATESVPAR
jgi:predicted phosphodiesterase